MKSSLITLCAIIFFCFNTIAQYPQEGQKIITDRNNLPKGWIIIGSSGTGLDARYTIIDGGRFDTGDIVAVCFKDNVEYSNDWQLVTFNSSGCAQCSITPPGGIAQMACWTYKKKTPKTVFSSNNQMPPANQNGNLNRVPNITDPKNQVDSYGFLHVGIVTRTSFDNFKNVVISYNRKDISCLEIIPGYLYLELKGMGAFDTVDKIKYEMSEFEKSRYHESGMVNYTKAGLHKLYGSVTVIEGGFEKKISGQTEDVIVNKGDKSTFYHFFIEDILSDYFNRRYLNLNR